MELLKIYSFADFDAEGTSNWLTCLLFSHQIVYVARNPRDVIVSNYFFTRNLRKNVPELTMEEYLLAFLAETSKFMPPLQ